MDDSEKIKKLFHFMLDLTEIEGQASVMQSFIKMANSIWPYHKFKITKMPPTSNNFSLAIKGKNKSFGYLNNQSDAVLNYNDQAILRKYCNLLASFLENNDFKDVLIKERRKFVAEANKTEKKFDEKSKRLSDSQKALTYLLEDVNQTQQELEKANNELAELNNELESFTYSVSHDLRAPLRAIDGFSKILLEDYTKTLDNEAIRLLNVIINNTESMKELIEGLLSFSRLGRASISYLKINTNELIRQILEENKSNFEGRKIIWKISKLPHIEGDRTIIKQVFFNLINNAVKFSKDKDPAIIKIEGEKLKDKIELSITDNGIGFNMDYVDKIFEVFQRLHSSEKFEGTGIGLASVKKALTKHNGTINAQSIVNQGAKFTIQLPSKTH